MSMKIKVQGGTPKSGKSLCITCKYSMVLKGQEGQEIIICRRLFDDRRPIPFKVAECSEYHPSNMPSLHEMEDMAWKIEARKRGPVGFEPEKVEMEIVITKPNSSPGDQ